MINKGIKITIPEPCSQDWAQLTVVEQGRFCASCDKVVIDFRKMSDNELLDYFTNHKGNVCGNFNPIQTERIILPLEYPLKPRRFSKFIASAIGVLLSLTAKSQNVDTTQRRPLVEINPLPIGNVTNQSIPKCAIKIENQLFQSNFHGKLGGVCISPVQVDNKSNTLSNAHIFNRIEEILRYF